MVSLRKAHASRIFVKFASSIKPYGGIRLYGSLNGRKDYLKLPLIPNM